MPPAAPTSTTAQPIPLNSDNAIRIARTELERDFYRQALESYQSSLETIKWAIGIIGTLVLALITYALFKDKKEYDNALKGAEKACEKAEQWEEKARGTCDKIDTLVKDKLVEIEKASEQKAQAVLDSIDKKAEAKLKNIGERTQKSTQEIDSKTKKQMRITEFWSHALRLSNEGKYEEACDKYAEIVKINPDIHEIYHNWCIALLELAKSKKGTPEYEGLLEQAEEKSLKAESLKKGIGAYNLACIYALRNNKEKCREWLSAGQEAGTLVTREHAIKDSDLDSVKNEPWFKEIKLRGEK
jgi:tetratricopeptide (TPR) repeat protein